MFFKSATALSLVLLMTSVQAQEDLPPNFPELRLSVNPLYHSVGLKLGHVLGVSRQRMVFRTFEGELMLGFGTGPERVVDRQCAQTVLGRQTGTLRSRQQDQPELRERAANKCTLFINPWPFSFLSRALRDTIEEIKDNPTAIYYVNYYIAPSHLLMKTKNQVLGAFPVQPDLKIEPSFRVSSWQALHPEAGVITGRIVQASLEYPVRKTYEIIIQERENANNFRAMSVNNGDMFRYINRAMLTGKQLRIEFIRLHRPHSRFLSALFNYMTNYRIISVEVLSD